MRSRVLLLLTGFLVLGLGWIAYQSIEFYEDTVDLGWSAEARRNPYLAAEQFLSLRGVVVKSQGELEALDSLDDTIDVIFIENIFHVVSTRQQQNLLHWVEQGGYLLAGVEDDEGDSENALLSALSLQVEDTEYNCECRDESVEAFFNEMTGEEVGQLEEDGASKKNSKGKKKQKKLSDYLREQQQKQRANAEKNADKEAVDEEQATLPESTSETDDPLAEKYARDEKLREREITILRFENSDESLRLHFSPYTALHHPFLDEEDETGDGPSYRDAGKSGLAAFSYKPAGWGGSDAGTHFIQFETGEGHMMFFSDASIWNSRNLDVLDHAYFLQQMIGDDDSLLLLYGVFMPSLLELVLRHFPELLLFSALLAVTFIACRSQRFGSVLSPAIRIRRSLAEHLQMRAHYRWRMGKYNLLLQPLQQDIRQTLQYRHPAVHLMNEAGKRQFISGVSRLPLSRVEVLMSMVAINDAQDFTRAIRDLQLIRSSL